MGCVIKIRRITGDICIASIKITMHSGQMSISKLLHTSFTEQRDIISNITCGKIQSSSQTFLRKNDCGTNYREIIVSSLFRDLHLHCSQAAHTFWCPHEKYVLYYQIIHVLNNWVCLISLFPTKINLIFADLGFMQAADAAIAGSSDWSGQVTNCMNNVCLHMGSK